MHAHVPGVARRATFALALASAVAGCGSKRRAAATPPPADAAVAGPVVHDLGATPLRPDEPHPPMPQELRTTVLETGDPPRTVRRYLTTPAPERTLTVRAAITVHGYRDGAWYGPTELPAITDGFGISVEAGASPTLVLRGLEGTVADAAPAIRASTDDVTARWRVLLERRRVAIAADARGRLGPITFVDDPDRKRADDELATDELVQRWLALAVPWPDEPIGPGARWRVVTLLRVGGAYFKQTATYKLAAVEGDRHTVEVDLTRLAERQLLDVPGLPAGATAELIGIVRSVKGTVVVTSVAPLPLSGELTSTQSTHAQFHLGPGAPIDEVTDDRATLTLTSK
ncbi:MAG: hypothetical protein IPL61_09190 [Myxococcales bacterium]|nr:hypothetical protein [Myxococcales bacterium]